MVVISSSANICQVKVSMLKRLLDTVDLEELPDSRERTGALVLWLSCEGQIDVWELFSDNFCLSAIFDRQGLMVAAPVDFRRKKAVGFSPQVLQGFLSKVKKKNPKIVVMSPTVTTKNLSVAEYQILGGKHFPFFGNRVRKNLVVKQCTIPSEEVPLPIDPPAWQETQVDFP